ncbi:DUF3015 family protein [Peredibacter starrii]|uniref:DUF3015 family protein n=1 Tax=Peredibacter starrii TaxID=28202 RepID=A0AAX4HSA6_9BACT|nr:DUF3015 family protein [Peredibacter starrii]WPU66053.1 DUF3015 family protein [Peredibacter starrii]
MKKLLVVVAVALMTSSAFAAKYGSAGCGLGSMIFEGDQTWWKQVLAATTNGTGVQTIGITLGTSNCDSPAPLKVGQAEAYVEANKVALANDIARGNGETIVGLSKVYGCTNAAQFGQALKSNYSTIFTSANSTSSEITHNINGVAATTCNTQI